ncbi:NAD(P)H-dependent oxidoreductase [Rhodospirillum sp. A1_3_36]|uniref:NAD(P)H-dependent oxidoreductase n=1 Tax=Rhodospirillum sp. A1_3_36 TaxID=3391666 RepID=UPI0039A5798C
MNVLFVFAHPDPHSLNGALRDSAVEDLKAQGHSVRITDLYAEGWKAVVDRADFPQLAPGTRLRVPQASRDAFQEKALTPDVQAEQEKLLWADTVILQFPLWWFAMPAILKGWVDRVYAYGFGYGVGEHSDRRWGDRYGEGTMAGKRAMLIVTAGGWESHYCRRGVNGFMEDLLFPIHHGILFYPGFEVLPPFVLYEADRLSEENYPAAAEALRSRMRTLETTQPIPYRRQNGGDYDIPRMELRAELDRPGISPFGLHLNESESRDGSMSNRAD